MTAYAFTGPHTAGYELRPYVYECLKALDPAPTVIITGCAHGIDTLAAEGALLHKELVKRFEVLAVSAERNVEIVTVYPRMSTDPMRGRNEYMVSRCDVLAAFPLTREYVRGGTWMTINIAKRAQRPVVWFPLEDAQLRRVG
jgi:hypothetical protein